MTDVMRTSDEMDGRVHEADDEAFPVVGSVSDVATGLLRRRRRLVAGCALGAAAAFVLIVPLRPVWLADWLRPDAPQLRRLIDAVGGNRLVDSRLTGGFRHGAYRPSTRSSTGKGMPSPNLTLLAVAGELQQRASDEPSAKNLHAWGVAQVLVGSWDAAVADLERAAALRSDDASVLTDLSAALASRARATDRAADWPKAFDKADRAVKLQPSSVEAWFNRAVALEGLGMADPATQAWEDYLRADSSSAWAGEARTRRQKRVSDSDTRPRTDPTFDRVEQQVLEWARAMVDAPNRPSWRDTAWADQGSSKDRLIARMVGEIEHAPPDRAAMLARAHLELSSVLDAYRLGQMDKLRNGGLACAASFATLASPLAVLCEYYAAVGEYYAGQHAPALERIARVAAAAEGYPLVAGRLDYVRAGLLFARNDYEHAIAWSRRAIVSLSVANDSEGLSAAHQMHAAILRSVGEPTQAWEEYRLASLTSAADHSFLRRYSLLNSIADAALSDGDARFALFIYTIARDLASQQTIVGPLVESTLNRARCLLRLGQLGLAYADLTAARTMLPRESDVALQARLGAELSFAEAEVLSDSAPQRALDAAQSALVSYQRVGVAIRLPTLHLLRSRALVRMGRLQEAEASLETGMAILESDTARLQERRLRISHLDRLWALYDDAVALRLRQGDGAGALRALDRGRQRFHYGVAARRTTTPVAPIPSGTVVVVFSTSGSELIRWTLDGRAIDWTVRSADVAGIERLVRSLREIIVRDTSRERKAESLLRAIGTTLLGDVRPLAKASRLVIVCSGFLTEVPFAALMPDDGPHLVERLEVVLAPSVPAFRAPATRAVTRVAVLVPPANLETGLPPLPGAAEEGRRVTAMYRSATLVTGADATDAVLLHSLSTADVVHLAGHAVADPAYPWNSRLQVAASQDNPRGFVFLPSLLNGRLQAITVLAACSTAVGYSRRAEGLVSLASAILAAGAPAVVGTIWDIDDAASVRLFEALHQNLARGLSAGQALRAAQQAERAAGVGPGGWAGIVALGDS